MCSTGVATSTATGPALPCPLCCQTNFPSVDSLRISLVSVSSRLLPCPICHEMLMGLDKLTIHLFSHTILSGNGVAETPPSSNLHRPPSAHHHPPAQHVDRATIAPSPSPSQPQPPRRIEAPRCQVCGCTFRNHELHQMHMQLIHDITIADALDDASSDGESGACMMSDAADDAGAPPTSNNDDASDAFYAPLPSSSSNHHQRQAAGGGQQQQQQQPCIKTAATTPRFQCHLCPKSFKLKGSLRVHLRVVHMADGTPFLVAGGDASTSSQSTAVVCTIPIVYEAATTASASDAHHQHLARSIVVSMGGVGAGGCGGVGGGALVSTPASSSSGWPEVGCAMDRNGSSGVGESMKLWECDICAKWFTTKYFLKKHKRLHTGWCDICCVDDMELPCYIVRESDVRLFNQ